LHVDGLLALQTPQLVFIVIYNFRQKIAFPLTCLLLYSCLAPKDLLLLFIKTTKRLLHGCFTYRPAQSSQAICYCIRYFDENIFVGRTARQGRNDGRAQFPGRWIIMGGSESVPSPRASLVGLAPPN